jgi:putative ABC transport system permease protein
MILLIRNNLQKGRGQMMSMLLIIIVAAILMNIGALALYDYGLFFDKKAAELNAPHVSIIIEKAAYHPAHQEFLASDSAVTQTAIEDVLVMPTCNFLFGDGKMSQGVVIQNADIEREMGPMTIVGESLEPDKNSIYAPNILRLGGGYELGDSFTLEYENNEYTFNIAGFVEDILLGSLNMGAVGFYMPEPLFKRFMAEGLAIPAVMLSAQLTDHRLSDDIVFGSVSYFSNIGGFSYSFPIGLVKMARSLTANITSMIVVAFAAIVTIIALIVIRFRISDSIIDDIKDIGILKAMGYTSSEAKTSMLLQYLSITFVGTIFGIAVSYVLLPMVSALFSAQAGLVWNQGFAPATSLVCLLIMLSAVALNILYCTRRVKTLNPIDAIRGDMKTSATKRNFFRLDKAAGGLQFSLACKLIVQSPGQNIMVGVIIAALTFASAFGLVFFYNMAVDSESFIKTIAGEICSVAVIPMSNLNTARMCEEIGAMPGARKAIYFDDISLLIGEDFFMANVTEDFDELEGQLLYEGSYPKSADEVVIGGSMAEQLGKAIGDTVKISSGSKEAEYTISGYIQSGNNIGRTLALSIEGMRRIMPDYLPWMIFVYLDEGESAEVFIELLNNRYGSLIQKPINFDEMIKAQTSSYVAILAFAAIVILIITALIVTLILYFIIKTMVIRKRRYFGVQKALGFVTSQLVQQISLSFLPVVLAGSLLGTAMAYIGVNPMISALFRVTGLMRIDLVMAHLWLAILCVGIAVLSYVVAIVISSRVRRISAYTLVTQ